MLDALWELVAEQPLVVSQTLFSFALVIVTVAYSYYTRGQAKEMEITRKQSNQPVVKGDIDLLGPNMICTLKNTGNGAAHDVRTKMYFEDMDFEPIEFKKPILTTGEEYEFGFPLGKEEGFSFKIGEIESKIEDNNSDGILRVETTCENAFGEEYNPTNEIDVLEVKEDLSQIVRDSEEEKIRKSIEGIESNIGDISDEVSLKYQDQIAYSEVYKLVRDEVESKGVIGFEDLKYRLGIQKDVVVKKIIDQLQRGGLVDYSSDKNLLLNENVEIEWIGGSVKDVDEETIGGTSGKQAIEQVMASREGLKQKDDPDNNRELEDEADEGI